MLITSSPLGRGQTRPLVVVASTAHGAAHRTQYPKDHAKDDQDNTDCPKDGVTPKKGRDEQADDANGDQVSLPCSGSSSASTLSDSFVRGLPYSDSPAASRASARSMTLSMRITEVPRKVQTWKYRSSPNALLWRPVPCWWT